MILSGKEIKKRLGTDIIIEPFNEECVNPNSYNVTLANELFIYEESMIDVKVMPKTKKIIIPEEGIVLEPNKLYIGRTNEYTETYNLVPMIEGRSSLGRLGIFTHASAGFGDVGYKGSWSVQLFSIHPVKIYPNMRIAQLYYLEILGEHDHYSSKYDGRDQIKTSLISTEF